MATLSETVMVSASEPSSVSNVLWVKPSSASRVQVPTVDEMNAAMQSKIEITGIIKAAGSGEVTTAVAGVDYAGVGHASSSTLYGLGDSNNYGHVKLSDAINSTSGSSGGIAATPAAVKTVKDLIVRENLLDNWYFVGGGSQLGYGVFPVNQRGQAVYTGLGYHIDRWINYNMSSLTINNDGITIVSSSQGYVAMQHVADATAVKSFAGKKLTASVLYASVSGGTAGIRIDCGDTVYYSTDISTGGLAIATGTVSANATKIDVSLRFESGVTAKVLAAKLEIGSTQTLAHQENGVWVLNEIPDYETELLRCKTSTADPSDTYANGSVEFGSNIGIVQNTNTAKQNITKGQYVIWHGALYTASAAIASGATLSSSNLTVVTGGGLNNLLALLYNIIGNNAGAHNSIYRGRYLGSSVTAEQWAAISAGTFDDLYIGDYWTIGGVNWRIAAFDYWLRTGDTECTTHHVVIVPDTALYNAKMNDSDVTTGAYVGSKMYTTNLATAKTTINNAFGSAHILNHREYLKNAVTGNYETAGAQYDSTVEFMTEQMAYGGKVFANAMQAGNWAQQQTVDKCQLPLFALDPSKITIRAAWWLRDVASSTTFCIVDGHGSASASDASSSHGVRPAFGIKA